MCLDDVFDFNLDSFNRSELKSRGGTELPLPLRLLLFLLLLCFLGVLVLLFLWFVLLMLSCFFLYETVVHPSFVLLSSFIPLPPLAPLSFSSLPFVPRPFFTLFVPLPLAPLPALADLNPPPLATVLRDDACDLERGDF